MSQPKRPALAHLATLIALVVCIFPRGICADETGDTTTKTPELRAFFEGYDLYQKGFFADAIPFLETAVKETPEHFPAYARLADCYEKLGQYDRAVPIWRRYLEIRPSQQEIIGAHVALLEEFVKAESRLRGIEDLTREEQEEIWLAVSPGLLKAARDRYKGSSIAEKAILLLLPRLISLEDYETGLELCRRIVREFPAAQTPRLQLWWGVCLRGCGQLLDALSALNKAEAMFDGDPVAQKECRRELALTHLALARGLMESGRYLPAREAFMLLRGRYMSALTPEEMLDAQSLIMGCEGSQVAEWIEAGDKYASQGMYEDAVRWYVKVRGLTFSNLMTNQAEERIRRIGQISGEKFAQIEQMLAQKQYNAAMKLCESIEESFGREARIKAMNKYADAAIAGKEYDLAARKLFALAQRYPEGEEGALAYARAGYMYGITAKDPTKGLQLFQEMARWNAGSRPARRESQLGIGIMLALLGRKDEATQILTAVAIEYKEDERVTRLCREYIWKCKNCSEIAL